jgi:hypothetical protein
MRPDWRILSLLLALFAAWAFAALPPGCDGGKPRPAELTPTGPDGQAERHHKWVREGRGLIDRMADKAAIAREVRAGWMTLPEAAAGEERRVRRWTKTKPNGCGTWR